MIYIYMCILYQKESPIETEVPLFSASHQEALQFPEPGSLQEAKLCVGETSSSLVLRTAVQDTYATWFASW